MMTPPAESALDRAVLAHRDCPCETHRADVMVEMRLRHERFLNEQTIEFQSRTH